VCDYFLDAPTADTKVGPHRSLRCKL
jgi:hypothetical protein